MKTTTARASVIVLLLCLLPRAIQASPIQLNFGGTVNAVEDPFGLIGSLVAIGDPIRRVFGMTPRRPTCSLPIRLEARICRPGG